MPAVNKLTKKRAQQIHAMNRARERHGLNLTLDLFLDLSRLAMKAPVLERQSNRISVREINHEGHRLVVVFDSHRGQIVTFLPSRCFSWIHFNN